nr:metalloregulator ArsR/SmtB family transcription factor [Paenibacillus sp. DMB20]
MIQLEAMADLLKLLGDKTRLTIIALLKNREELCVCDIVECLHTTQPNVSQHLRKLKAADLVRESRRGQWVYYSLSLEDKPYLQRLIDELPPMEQPANTCCRDEA